MKSTVLKPRLKLLLLSDGSWRLSGNEFQAIGPPTAKTQRPNVLRRNCGVSTGKSQMLSTGDIGDWDAVVDRVLWCFILKTPVNRHSQLVQLVSLLSAGRDPCMEQMLKKPHHSRHISIQPLQVSNVAISLKMLDMWSWLQCMWYVYRADIGNATSKPDHAHRSVDNRDNVNVNTVI